MIGSNAEVVRQVLGDFEVEKQGGCQQEQPQERAANPCPEQPGDQARAGNQGHVDGADVSVYELPIQGKALMALR